jgi:exodeoxyribonuclease VII large subunit
MVDSKPKTNAPDLSVSELSAALKRTVEDRFGYVRVRGEISNYRGPHSSGHAYFSLKDDGARIDAVIWKTAFSRLKHKPQEGLDVVAVGKITTFPGKSSYQIVIESLEPAGVGALMALLDARRKQLAAEGLFDPAGKKRPPFFPLVIGVVTSPTGAVIRDILHRISDRFPTRVLVWPVRVQGETAAAEVARAIDGFNALQPGSKLPRPDVLIVARGGGSLEDLWAFNEEIVVRAAAASAIPLISAIGHETDTTLIDHAADLRAPTPTGAAEKATPVRRELQADLADAARRLSEGLRRAMDARARDVRSLSRVLLSPDDVLAAPRQRLDTATAAARNALRAGLDARRRRLDASARTLATHSPQAELAHARGRLNVAARALHAVLTRAQERRRERLGRDTQDLQRALAARLRRAQDEAMRNRQRLADLSWRQDQAFARLRARRAERLGAVWRLAETLSHKATLARGFALVLDEEKRPLRSAAALYPGQNLLLEFADGKVAARAGEGALATSDGSAHRRALKDMAKAPDAAPPRLAQRKARPKSDPSDQGSLF